VANPQSKTHSQVKAIFAEAKKRGFEDEDLRDVVEDVTRRTRHISELSYSEAQNVIRRLKAADFVPTRTLQHRRAKSGVKQVVTPEMLTLIAELASQRNWSAETLQNFCLRQCKKPKPRTTADANKVIEALKSMNKREGLWAADAA
jgi:hypothetical protein